MARSFSKQVKRDLWARCLDASGVPLCESCTAPLRPGHFVYDHMVRYELSHDSTFENGWIICDTCDDLKTYVVDLPAAAKSKRVRDLHIGASPPPRHPMPCGRKSKRSKSMSGRIVTRQTLSQKMAAMRQKLGGVYLLNREDPT